MYLRIANPGVADPHSLITLGMSTTRYSDKYGLVGVFGSGSKLSLALLLRNNINPVIYISNLQMHFFTKSVMSEGNIFHKIFVKYAGKDLNGRTKNNTEATGFTTEYGAVDWKNVAMAGREFVSNAIDGCIRNDSPISDVEIEIVEKPRAKNGWTQVFIPLTNEIRNFYDAVEHLFLHFRDDNSLEKSILPKAQNDRLRIYKKGVLVFSFEVESIYDYNVGDELKLDESRNASEWDVRYAVACTIAKHASLNEMENILKGMISNDKCWENKIEKDYLSGKYVLTETKMQERQILWQQAWKNVYGKDAVACNNVKGLSDFVEKKGFTPVIVSNEILTLVESVGVTSQNSVLTGQEQKGRIVNSPSPKMEKMVDYVWKILVDLDMVNNKEKPVVMGFYEQMQGGSQVWGEYDFATQTVYLHNDLSGFQLMKVTLEEITHHVTNGADMSRDLQDYLFRLITKIYYKE